MTPKPVQWIGTVLIVGILVVIGASAVQNIIRGEAARAEIITVVVAAVVILATLALRLVTRRTR